MIEEVEWTVDDGAVCSVISCFSVKQAFTIMANHCAHLCGSNVASAENDCSTLISLCIVCVYCLCIVADSCALHINVEGEEKKTHIIHYNQQLTINNY